MTNPDHLRKKVELAKLAVDGLEEPFKTEAFKIILSKLLGNESKEIKGEESKKEKLDLIPQLKTKEQSKMMPNLNRSKYSEIYKLDTALERSLFILKIHKDDCDIDGLSPPKIAKILTETFRIKTKK